MTFLAIDLGTSFIKGAVLDLERCCLQHIRRRPVPRPVAGLPLMHRELDPCSVVAAVQELIADLLPHASDCEGLVMCGQMHSLLLTGPRGEPLTNAITWQDQRSLEPHPYEAASYFEVLLRRLGPVTRQDLGNDIAPGMPLPVLFYLAERDELPSNGLVASLPDFVLASLCDTAPVVELTQAAATGALDLTQLDWHTDAIAALGQPRVRWPTLQPFHQRVGLLRIGGQVLSCFAPVGDQQCALAGAFLQPGELSVNISTGSQVAVISPEFVPGCYQTRPYFDGSYLSTVTRIPAGRSLSALVRLLCELPAANDAPLTDPWSYIATATERVPATDLQVNLAFFASACGDRGAIENIREDNLTIGHLFRAAFQNMVDNYYACSQRLPCSRGWRELVFSGGLAESLPMLRDMVARRLNLPYRTCLSAEDALLGLLVLALVCSGRASSVAEATAMVRSQYSR